MKTRIISAIVALAIFIPIFIMGGIIFKIAVGILTLLGFKEFVDIKETKKVLPNFIKIMSYFLVLMIVFGIEMDDNFKILIDFRLLTVLCLCAFLNLNVLIFLFLITIMTDSYAYFTGYLIGRHKLLEVISPKKTFEGLVGGTIVGVFISVVFYLTAINANVSLVNLVLITTFLSFTLDKSDVINVSNVFWYIVAFFLASLGISGSYPSVLS